MQVHILNHALNNTATGKEEEEEKNPCPACMATTFIVIYPEIFSSD